MRRITTFIAAACLLAALAAPTLAQEFTPDASTLLLLHANGTATGAAGETPQTSVGVGYGAGIFSQAFDLPSATYLRYAAAGNLNAAAGTIEFWLKPNWNGNDNQNHIVLSWGTWGGVMVVKDAANNMRIMINRWANLGLPERGAAWNVGAWTAGQWHHCAFTWDSAYVRCYIDGVLRGGEAVGFTPAGPGSTYFQLSGEGAGYWADGVIDEFRISDTPRTAAEVEAAYLAGLIPTSLTATPRVTKLWVTWPVYATLTAGSLQGDVTIPHVDHTNLKVPDLPAFDRLEFTRLVDGVEQPFGVASKRALTLR